MTKVENIIEEINHLDSKELELVFKALKKRLNRKARIEQILDEYAGIGKGVWEEDPQKHIDELRNEDRSY